MTLARALSVSGLDPPPMRTVTFFRAITATVMLATAAMVAVPASAATPIITLSAPNDPTTLPVGQQLIADFNNANTPTAVLLPGFSLVLTGSTVGVGEGQSGYSGTLPNDPTHYLTIPANASASLFSTAGLLNFSFYMGSADTYNSVQFIGDNYNYTLNGGAFTGGYVGQSWNWGRRINFDFGGARVNQVILRSSGNSFELDNLAGSTGAVPEPATWAMMIIGFGAVGSVLRQRRLVLQRA
eukprot:gene51821-69357_t